jgi:hypothetical protein
MKLEVREMQTNEKYWRSKFPECIEEEENLEVNPSGHWTSE